MKLSARQATRISDRFGVEVVEEDDPAVDRLVKTFGEHTFFVDADGLNVVEPPHPDGEGSSGVVVKLASWTDDGGGLQVHEPEVLPLTVEIEPDGSDPAA